jgi:hypothetical protein
MTEFAALPGLGNRDNFPLEAVRGGESGPPLAFVRLFERASEDDMGLGEVTGLFVSSVWSTWCCCSFEPEPELYDESGAVGEMSRASLRLAARVGTRVGAAEERDNGDIKPEGKGVVVRERAPGVADWPFEFLVSFFLLRLLSLRFNFERVRFGFCWVGVAVRRGGV